MNTNHSEQAMRTLLTDAMSNEAFLEKFARCGGGYHPATATDDMSESEIINRWLATDKEWLAMDHRIADTGEQMTIEMIQAQLNVRNIQRKKLACWFIGFLHGLNPIMHASKIKQLAATQYHLNEFFVQ